MPERPPDDPALQQALAILKFKRDKNEFVRVELLLKIMAEHGLSPADIGASAEELRLMAIEDCRHQVENDLTNWRITYEIQAPGEKCFAQGVLEALHDGGLKPEDFEISDIELRYIRQAAELK